MIEAWQVDLRAQRKSPATVRTYTHGVQRFLAWCAAEGRPAVLDKPTVTAFTVSLLDGGAEPSTVVSRQLAVRRLAAWLAAEGDLDADPLLGLKSPKLDTKVVQPLTGDELRALLKACRGGARPAGRNDLRGQRDEAILRLMTETGARAGEVVALCIEDVNPAEGTAVVQRGKGGKGRIVPYGPQTSSAMSRYIRQSRAAHRLASTPALWLGDRGKEFSYDGLYRALRYRAELAGVDGFHPHRLRHTAAHRWLEAGGSEGGLMAVAGWTRPDMLLRYTRAQASARAAEESRRLNLGEL